MSRARNAVGGPIPDSLREYGEMINSSPRFSETLDGQPFYRGTVFDPNGDTGVLFASPTILSRLPRQLKHLLVDGTFKAVPRAPYSYQLLTASVIIFDKVSAFLFIYVINKLQFAIQF